MLDVKEGFSNGYLMTQLQNLFEFAAIMGMLEDIHIDIMCVKMIKVKFQHLHNHGSSLKKNNKFIDHLVTT